MLEVHYSTSAIRPFSNVGCALGKSGRITNFKLQNFQYIFYQIIKQLNLEAGLPAGLCHLEKCLSPSLLKGAQV
jgi:hypothetical protein